MNDNTGNLTYGSRAYVMLCYAKMRGAKWFSREDYRKFQLHKPSMTSKLATSADRLVRLGFLEMLVERDTEYYRITIEGSRALAALGSEQAEKERLIYVENARRNQIKNLASKKSQINLSETA